MECYCLGIWSLRFLVKVLISTSQSLKVTESNFAQSLPLICAKMYLLENLAFKIEASKMSGCQAKEFANLLFQLQDPSQEYFYEPLMKLHTYYCSYYFAYCFACSFICCFVYCSVCSVRVSCYFFVPKVPYLRHLIPPILDSKVPLNWLLLSLQSKFYFDA